MLFLLAVRTLLCFLKLTIIAFSERMHHMKLCHAAIDVYKRQQHLIIGVNTHMLHRISVAALCDDLDKATLLKRSYSCLLYTSRCV